MKKRITILPLTVAISLGASGFPHTVSSSERSAVLEEVVVTARKREESLQESPVAITAITGDALREAGINNVAELTNSVPSLQINKGQANQIFIRGVGQRASTLKVDPAVGVYVDGVFMPRTDGQFLDSLAIQSVQVLRGPQGTLFGKNNTGGALVFTLEKPHDELSGHMGGTVGNYNSTLFSASINLPVSETFMTRFGYSYIKDDGYVDDISQNTANNSNDRQSLIGQFRWDGSDTLTLDGMLYIGETRERFPGNNCEIINENALLIDYAHLLVPGDTDPNDPSAYQASCNANNRDNLPDLTTNMGGHHQMDSDLVTILGGLSADWKIGDESSAKFILGYGRQIKGPLLNSDSDSGVLSLFESYYSDDSERNWTSLEAQFSGVAFESRLNYTVGLFAMVENGTEEHTTITTLLGIDPQHLGPLLNPAIPALPPLPGTTPLVGALGGGLNFQTEFDLTNTTLAAFGQASWDFSDSTQLTLGVRHTAETRDAELISVFTDNASLSAQLTACDPRFVPLDTSMALHTFAGSWLQDPVGAAMDCFRDTDGDGYVNAPLDLANAQVDKRKETFTKTTPMVSLSYVLPEDYLDGELLTSAMTYATFSTGFKSGFFEPRGVDGLQRIEPEEVINREIGFKIDALERSLRVNVALYSMLYKDMQLIQVSTDSQGTLAIVFNNVGEAVIEGGELEVTWLPSANWMLNFSYSNNNYKFNEFMDGNLFTQFQGIREDIDRSDENFPVSPEKTAALGIQYLIDTPVGIVVPRLDIAYKGDIYMGFDDGAWTVYKETPSKVIAEAFTLINFRLSWQNQQGDLNAALFVKNATDERYDIGAVAIGDSLGIHSRVYGAPRTYGLEIRREF